MVRLTPFRASSASLLFLQMTALILFSRAGVVRAFVRDGARTSAAAAVPSLAAASTAAGSASSSVIFRRHSLFGLRAGAATSSVDTPSTLPDFSSKDEYLKFMEPLSGLPRGFATGTASGTFVSKEAPSMGKLPIRGTVIHLTEGPTDNWAAVFTKNKVRSRARYLERTEINVVVDGDDITVFPSSSDLLVHLYYSSPALPCWWAGSAWRPVGR